METGQRMIEGFFAGKEKVSEDNGGSPRKPERKRRRSDVVNEDVGPSRLRVDHLAQNNLDDQDHEAELRHTEDQFAYTCDRCGRRIELPCSILQRVGPTRGGNDHGNRDIDPAVVVVEEGLDEEEADAIKEALERLRTEHDDFHFAQDLQKESDGPSGGKLKPGDSRSKAANTTDGVGRSGSSSKSAANKKRKTTKEKPTAKMKEPRGNIAKFFVQK